MSKREGLEGAGKKEKSIEGGGDEEKKRRSSVKQLKGNERKTGKIADFNFLPF